MTIKKIVNILDSYSSVYDGCIAPIDFEDVAIDIHNTICVGEAKMAHPEVRDDEI